MTEKIAVIGSKGLHSEYGGVEKIVYHLSVELAKEYDVTVFGSSRYCDVPSLDTGKVQAKYFNLPRVKLSGAAVLACLSTLYALSKNYRLFYFHACGPGFFSFLPRVFGKPVLWHFHGADYKRAVAAMKRFRGVKGFISRMKQVLRYLFLKAGEIIAVHSAHRVLVLGRANYERISREYSSSVDKFVLVSNFSQLTEREEPGLLDEFNLSPGKYLVTVSRLVAEKGIDLLIKGFLRGKSEIPDMKLAIVGDGDERTRLETLAGGDDSIIFVGARPHREMYTFYRHARLFCLCSSIEGQSLSLLEAMTSHCPVFAYRLPEVEEFGADVFTYFDHRDPKHLGESLLKVLEAPEDLEKLADKALELVRQFYSRDNAVTVITSQLSALLSAPES